MTGLLDLRRCHLLDILLSNAKNRTRLKLSIFLGVLYRYNLSIFLIVQSINFTVSYEPDSLLCHIIDNNMYLNWEGRETKSAVWEKTQPRPESAKPQRGSLRGQSSVTLISVLKV